MISRRSTLASTFSAAVALIFGRKAQAASPALIRDEMTIEQIEQAVLSRSVFITNPLVSRGVLARLDVLETIITKGNLDSLKAIRDLAEKRVRQIEPVQEKMTSSL